jgi:hypothetical protein
MATNQTSRGREQNRPHVKAGRSEPVVKKAAKKVSNTRKRVNRRLGR